MQIEIAHDLGEAKAMGRVDEFLDDLARRDFQGAVKIKNPTRTWSGNCLTLSFSLVRGFFAAPLSGTLRVTDRLVTLDAAIPGMVAAFVGEDRIRTAIERELTRALAKD